MQASAVVRMTEAHTAEVPSIDKAWAWVSNRTRTGASAEVGMPVDRTRTPEGTASLAPVDTCEAELLGLAERDHLQFHH